MDWYDISSESTLSLEFIEEHKHVIDWFSICLDRNLDLELFKKYISYISYENCSKNKHLNQEQVHILREYYMQFWKQHIECELTSRMVDENGFTHASFSLKLNPSIFPKAEHISCFSLQIATIGPTKDYTLKITGLLYKHTYTHSPIIKNIDLSELCSLNTHFEAILHMLDEELLSRHVFQEPIFYNTSSS